MDANESSVEQLVEESMRKKAVQKQKHPRSSGGRGDKANGRSSNGSSSKTVIVPFTSDIKIPVARTEIVLGGIVYYAARFFGEAPGPAIETYNKKFVAKLQELMRSDQASIPNSCGNELWLLARSAETTLISLESDDVSDQDRVCDLTSEEIPAGTAATGIVMTSRTENDGSVTKRFITTPPYAGRVASCWILYHWGNFIESTIRNIKAPTIRIFLESKHDLFENTPRLLLKIQKGLFKTHAHDGKKRSRAPKEGPFSRQRKSKNASSSGSKANSTKKNTSATVRGEGSGGSIQAELQAQAESDEEIDTGDVNAEYHHNPEDDSDDDDDGGDGGEDDDENHTGGSDNEDTN